MPWAIFMTVRCVFSHQNSFAPPPPRVRCACVRLVLQISVLMVMSVLLLTVPWMKDHPVTLIVPVVLFLLPATSQALRPMVAEAFGAVFSVAKWWFRNSHDDSAAHAQQQHGHQGRGGGATLEPRRQQQHHHQQQHAYAAAPLQHQQQPYPPYGNVVPVAASWQAGRSQQEAHWARQAPPEYAHGAGSMQQHSGATPATELVTPDLDFDDEPNQHALPTVAQTAASNSMPRQPYFVGAHASRTHDSSSLLSNV